MRNQMNYGIRPPHHFRNIVIVVVLAIVAVGAGAGYAKYRDNGTDNQQRTTQQATQPQNRSNNNGNSSNNTSSNNSSTNKPSNNTSTKQPGTNKATNNRANHKVTVTPTSSNWKPGLPSIFSQNSYWISNFKPASHPSKKDVYERVSSPFDSNISFNPTISMFDKNHKPTMSGADESATAGVHPHFKSLGNNKFVIAGGAKDLHDELNNSGSMVGNVDIIKIIDHNHMKLWTFDNNSMHKYYKTQKLEFVGTFARYPHNNNVLKKVLGM